MSNQAVIPHLTIDDANGACDFYVRAFGASVLSKRPGKDGGKLLQSASTEVRSIWSTNFPSGTSSAARRRRRAPLGGTAVAIHLEVADVDAVHAKASEGLKIELWEPKQAPEG